MFRKKKTFEELVAKIGLETVFDGTNADATIQQIFLDWLFDYKLCSEDDNTFLRYFRRRFNNLYPRYLEQVRILTVRDNFDPFVTEYFQDLINRVDNETNTGSKTANGESTSSVTATKGSGSTTVRTPDLVSETVDSNTVTNEGTVTNSGTDRTTKTGTETTDRDADNVTTRTGTDTTVNHEEATNDTTGKSDAFGIAYPESNLGAIPANLDAQRSIDYANSESLSMNKSHSASEGDSTSTVTHNTSDETVIDETDVTTHNTTDATTYGLATATQNETVGSGTSTTSETGTERTVVTNNGADVTSTTNGNEVTESTEGERNATGKVEQEHKGRNESVADIIPRAIKAIVNTNEVMWFIDSMKVCFDCTSFDY